MYACTHSARPPSPAGRPYGERVWALGGGAAASFEKSKKKKDPKRPASKILSCPSGGENGKLGACRLQLAWPLALPLIHMTCRTSPIRRSAIQAECSQENVCATTTRLIASEGGTTIVLFIFLDERRERRGGSRMDAGAGGFPKLPEWHGIRRSLFASAQRGGRWRSDGSAHSHTRHALRSNWNESLNRLVTRLRAGPPLLRHFELVAARQATLDYEHWRREQRRSGTHRLEPHCILALAPQLSWSLATAKKVARERHGRARAGTLPLGVPSVCLSHALLFFHATTPPRRTTRTRHARAK